MARAACRGSDSALDFHASSPTAQAKCIEVCALCPVRVECLEWAAESEDSWRFGIWGGTAPRDRRKCNPHDAVSLEASFQERLAWYRRIPERIAERRRRGRKKAAQARQAKKSSAA